MIDQVTVHCTARGVESALERVEVVQSLLMAIDEQLAATGGCVAANVTLRQAEMQLAQAHGVLAVINVWLSPETEGGTT